VIGQARAGTAADARRKRRARQADSVHTPAMRTEWLLVAFGCTLFLSNQPARDAADSSPIGTWRGDSTCMVKPSACHDEDSKYRFSAVEGSGDRLQLAASKIVDKQEVLMGTSECRYDSQKHAVDCPLPNENIMHFDVTGRTMNGTMKQRDGTLWRKIVLHRVDEP
jgi:hypothetical protein